MDPTRPAPTPELARPLPEWTRPAPTRYRSLFIIFRNGPDPIRSDTEAYTSFPGMDPILSDPIRELRPPYSGMDPTRSDPMPRLTRLLPKWARPYLTRYRSLLLSSGADPILSGPKPELVHLLPECIRSYPIRYRSLCILYLDGSDII
jgi:hypothetical protein